MDIRLWMHPKQGQTNMKTTETFTIAQPKELNITTDEFMLN